MAKITQNIITDNNNDKLKLIKEQYLGKGAFGRCYVLRCINTGKTYAGKFLHKQQIKRYNMADKIIQEINIHKSLNHANIVGFESCIEDKSYIYIILELCSNRSMSELLQRRKCVLLFEAKYFIKQVVSAVSYLHQNRIIHRDLTLANMFINCNMIVKVGDFGLAINGNDDNCKQFSLCGTPNYIAPEVLNRKCHSYKVDIWAIGCILYTLLTGTPPFQTDTVEKTYKLITKCQYSLPESIKNCTASSFITCTLQKDPKDRPSIYELSNHDFLHAGFIPKTLPPSSTVMVPTTKTILQYDRQRKSSPLGKTNLLSKNDKDKLTSYELLEVLQNLKDKIKYFLTSNTKNNTDDLQNPSLRPLVWINSWIYCAQKRAFGYRLNDNSVSALFTDNTTLTILPRGKIACYYDKDGTKFVFEIDYITTAKLNNKMIISKSYRKFMFDSLKNAYDDSDTDDIEPLYSVPILKSWVITENITGMYLSNGTLQLHFRYDHIKLIFSHEMNSITVINNGNQFYTYQLDLLKIYGCDDLLKKKLNLSVNVIKYIIDTFSKTWITTGQR